MRQIGLNLSKFEEAHKFTGDLNDHDDRLRYHHWFCSRLASVIYNIARLAWATAQPIAEMIPEELKAAYYQTIPFPHAFSNATKTEIKRLTPSDIEDIASDLGVSISKLAAFEHLSPAYPFYLQWPLHETRSNEHTADDEPAEAVLSKLDIHDVAPRRSVSDRLAILELKDVLKNSGKAAAVRRWISMFSQHGNALNVLSHFLERRSPAPLNINITLLQSQVLPTGLAKQADRSFMLSELDETQKAAFNNYVKGTMTDKSFTGSYHPEALFLSLKLPVSDNLHHDSIPSDVWELAKKLDLSHLGVSTRCCPVCSMLLKITARRLSITIRSPEQHATYYACVLPPWLPARYADEIYEKLEGSMRRAVSTLAKLGIEGMSRARDRGTQSPEHQAEYTRSLGARTGRKRSASLETIDEIKENAKKEKPMDELEREKEEEESEW